MTNPDHTTTKPHNHQTTEHTMRRNTEVKGEVETREDLEKAMGDYARADLALRAAKVEKERAIQEARERYEAVEPALKAAAEAAFKQLELWARLHPEAFDEKKSLELVQGRIGFRTGMPRVYTPRGMDEEKLCEALENHGFGAVVRTVRELDRQEAIRLSASANEAEKHLSERLAAEFGIRVKQGERFYAEAREEKTDA